MGEALGVLGLMAFLGVLFVAVWVISGAAERYFRRKRRESGVELAPLNAGSFWGDLKDAMVTIGSGIGTLVTGLVGCIGSLIGCLFFLVLGLVGLFFFIWLIKRMWEAA